MNNAQIMAAKPGQVLWDDAVRGLHVRVSQDKAGKVRRAFYVIFRPKGRSIQRRPKLGDYGTITLSQARDVARAMLAEVAKGNDPVAERKTSAAALSFGQLCDRYLDFIKTDPREGKKPHSIADDENYIERFLRPKWGREPATAITREDVEKLHASMSGTPHQANRVLSLISRICTLAERWRLRQEHSNPARLVVRYPEKPRRRIMRDDEGPRIAAALAAREASSPRAALFIFLLLYSGARPDELARATWHDVHIDVLEDDDGERVERWSIRLTTHKTDDTLAERVIALPPQIVERIKDLPRPSGSFLGVQASTVRKLWHKVREDAGCCDLRLYDLRRSFASAGLRAGDSLETIGQTLGHSSPTTTRSYAWLADELRAGAAGRAADVMSGILAPRQKPQKALPAPAKDGGAS